MYLKDSSHITQVHHSQRTFIVMRQASSQGSLLWRTPAILIKNHFIREKLTTIRVDIPLETYSKRRINAVSSRSLLPVEQHLSSSISPWSKYIFNLNKHEFMCVRCKNLFEFSKITFFQVPKVSCNQRIIFI